MSSNPVDVVLDFERRINSRSPALIAELLATDSVFIDSLGSRVQGLNRLRGAWEGYFRIVPDYSISHEEIFQHDDWVAMFGTARGSFSQDGRIQKENFWTTTAAWLARVEDGKISSWQIFSDNEPIRAIMRKTSGKE